MRKKLLPLAAMALLLVLWAACAQAQTTTVMMYMCGSDIQEDCVTDMYEMCAVDLPEGVTVAVQAGGAESWPDADLEAYKLNRFAIGYESFEDLETVAGASMGEQGTLESFLSWATSAYPADRYALILWNHGGGSVSGICFDATANDDSLTVHEINDALGNFSEANPGFHLELVGFDACLMATYELAVHMSDFATYMVASEETEPYLGWNYAWLETLAEDPDADMGQIAVSIADNYMEACMEDNPDDHFCLSVTYLPAMPYLTEQMESFAASLCGALDNGELATLSRARQRMFAFGGFDDASSDQVDFMALLDATRSFAPNQAAVVESAYQKAIYYSIGTDTYDYLTGLSIQMPMDDPQSMLDSFDTYACTVALPNYSDFVHGFATKLLGGDYIFTAQAPTQVSTASSGNVLSGLLDTTYTPGSTYVAAADAEVEAPTTGGTIDWSGVAGAGAAQASIDWSGVTNVTVGTVVPDQTQSAAKPLPEDSAYACTMVLGQDELNNLSMVEGVLYLDASDEEDTILVELGAMQNAGIDWETGTIVSEFDGTWPMLDDQLVVIYDQMKTDSMRRCIIPVTCNGEAGYLVVMITKARPEGVITGFTRGYDEAGLPERGLQKLAVGDVIVPTYPMLYDDGTGEMVAASFEGDPITVGEELPEFSFESLEGSDSAYCYCFRLTDIYGESHLSEMISFEL